MAQTDFSFTLEVVDKETAARAGVFRTAHSEVQTPVFMPVATNAAVRGQRVEEVLDLGFQVLLANTYHLLLRPGTEVFEQFGGIHKFMQWPHSILTDSGGYQLFSLSEQLRINEEGAEFKSYVDGRRILLSPEISISTQKAIGSDIMMVLDHCIQAPSDRTTTEQAMHRTNRWAKRSLAARGDSRQALFGIVQGGCFPELRQESAAQITQLDFDGFAIGGVAVGEEIALRNDIVEGAAGHLPTSRPRYLMGVGTPIDLLESVARGMDMFDCIIPTAFATQGVCFTSKGRVKLPRGVYARSSEPLDGDCACSTCAKYSRAYLQHILKAGEHLAQTLIGIHNLAFYAKLMEQMRFEICAGTFSRFYRQQKEVLGAIDVENPISPPRRKSRRHITELGDYQLHRHDDLVFVRQKSSGEVMHSVTDPKVEAEVLYIAQSKFRDRIREPLNRPLVIWDVGLGAANNAMAVIEAYEHAVVTGEAAAQVQLVSFERDLDSLRLALRHPGAFSHLRHQAPHSLLQHAVWSSKKGGIEWKLLKGDFLDCLQLAPSPDLVFFDPFSSKTDGPLWTLRCFKSIFSRTRPETQVFTYSASTGVRAGLLAAGFYVAKGVPIGPKEETTVAMIKAEAHFELLDAAWLARWVRSQSQFPVLSSDAEKAEVQEKISQHPQFQL